MCRRIVVVAAVSVCVVASATALYAGESGSVIVWGYEGDGLHDVPEPNSGFEAIAAGAAYALGLKTDGSIVAWGDNTYGQRDVPAPNADFVAVAAGASHSLGLKADGSIVAWGWEFWGACDVPTPNTGFVAIAAGADDSLGLKADGTVVAWGWFAWLYGWLDLWPPANTVCTSVAVGGEHCLGLKTDGSIIPWGDNWWGQCDVPEPNAGFVAVSAGQAHSLGLKADGSIAAWGGTWPSYGECDVPAPNTGFVAVAAGDGFSMGLQGGALPGIISASWSTPWCQNGDTVGLTVQTEGLDGTAATFEIYEKDSHEGSPDEFVTTIDAGPVKDGAVSAYWNVMWQEDGLLGIFNPPEFYFTVRIGDLSQESNLLVVNKEKETIVRPMIGLPVIQKRGGTFQIEIKSGALGLTLDDFAVTVSLDLSSIGSETTLARGPLAYNPDRALWVLTATLPDDLATGLYDLRVTVEGRELVRPNAVSVVSEFSDDPLICFITDIHADFCDMLVDEDSGIEGENWRERTQYFSARLREAKDLHADFILIGGDNVDWSAETNWQWFYDTLLQSEVPTFVQVGNHDYRDESADIRTGLPPVSGWLEIDFADQALAFFWDNICSQEHFMHYSFDYGDKVHVIGLNSGPDNFSQPDAITDILGWDYVQGKGLTNEQMAWLADDLSDSHGNVIFMHHPVFGGEDAPYDDSAISNRDEFRKLCRDSRTTGHDIVAVFSGHVHRNQIWPADGTSYITADQACRAPLSVLTRLSEDLYFAGGVDLAYADAPGGFAESGLYFEVTAEQP